MAKKTRKINKTKPKKQSSSRASSLGARVLRGYKPTREEILMLAASVLAQDETKS